jgi:hypothetical protein
MAWCLDLWVAAYDGSLAVAAAGDGTAAAACVELEAVLVLLQHCHGSDGLQAGT